MERFLAVSKALADSNRIRILLSLRGRELCVCQITELLELAPSTVSKHVSILRQAGLVASRKDGRWVYYRRPERPIPNVVRGALRWVDASLAGDREVRTDERRLKRILRIPVEELCRMKETS
jgi:DNA-binding transcriptional ArsR family regulator